MDIFRGETIYLRLMEPEDYEVTYKWRNDYNIQKMTCGALRYISKEMEKNWTHTRSLDNSDDIYLAICEIENDKMIGWFSINDIDYRNRKCHCGGIVIGEKSQQDGFAFHETWKLIMNYIFNELNMNRTTGECLKEHIMSRADLEANYWMLEGIEREGVFKAGGYHDIYHYGILKKDYEEHKSKGDYESEILILRTVRIAKRIKEEL